MAFAYVASFTVRKIDLAQSSKEKIEPHAGQTNKNANFEKAKSKIEGLAAESTESADRPD